MKTLIYLMILILLVGNPDYAFTESTTTTVTISFVVLEAAPTQLQETAEVRACLKSQLEKNPQSLPQIKVEELALSTQPSAAKNYRYTICEKP